MFDIRKNPRFSTLILTAKLLLVSLLILGSHAINLPSVALAQSDLITPVTPTDVANPLSNIPTPQEQSVGEPIKTSEITQYTPNEIIIVYKNEVQPVGTVSELYTGTINITQLLKDDSEALNIVSENLEAVGLTGDFEIFGGSDELNAKFVRISEDFDPLEKALALNELDWIDYAQPNYLYNLASASTGNSGGTWYTRNTNLEGAHEYLENKNLEGRKPLVAVLDLGTFNADVNSSRLTTNEAIKDNIAGTVIIKGGEDFNNPSSNNHGTQVASVLTGKRKNNTGTYGVYKNGNVALISINDGNSAPTTNVIAGIEYAARIGAKIVNMSFFSEETPTMVVYEGITINGLEQRENENRPNIGPFNSCSDIKTSLGAVLHGALESYSRDGSRHNVLFVAAAGNDSRELNKNAFRAPQSLVENIGYNGRVCIPKLDNLIVVGGTERLTNQTSVIWEDGQVLNGGYIKLFGVRFNRRQLQGSDYSPRVVHIAAPAQNILISYNVNTTDLEGGTSLAAPQVAGAAALALRASASYDFNARDLIYLINNTGRTQENLRPYFKGGKTLDIERLVRCASKAGRVFTYSDNADLGDTVSRRCTSLRISLEEHNGGNVRVRVEHAVSGDIKLIATKGGEVREETVTTDNKDYIIGTFTGLGAGDWVITAEHVAELGETSNITSMRNPTINVRQVNVNISADSNSSSTSTQTPVTQPPPSRNLPDFSGYITKFETSLSYEKSVTFTENDTSRPLTYNLQRWVAYPRRYVTVGYEYRVPQYRSRDVTEVVPQYKYRVRNTYTYRAPVTRYRWETRTERECVRRFLFICREYETVTKRVRVSYTAYVTRTGTYYTTHGPYDSPRTFSNSTRISPRSKTVTRSERYIAYYSNRTFTTRRSNSDYIFVRNVTELRAPNPSGRWVYMSNVAASSVRRWGTNPDRYLTPTSYAQRTITVRATTNEHGTITGCYGTCATHKSRLYGAPVMAVRNGVRTNWANLKRGYEQARSYDNTIKADHTKVMVYEARQAVTNLGYGIAPLATSGRRISVSALKDIVSSVNKSSAYSTHSARMTEITNRVRRS